MNLTRVYLESKEEKDKPEKDRSLVDKSKEFAKAHPDMIVGAGLLLAGGAYLNPAYSGIGSHVGGIKLAMNKGLAASELVSSTHQSWTASPNWATSYMKTAHSVGTGHPVSPTSQQLHDVVLHHKQYVNSKLPNQVELFRGLTGGGSGAIGSASITKRDVVGAHLNGETHVDIPHRSLSSWTSKEKLAHNFALGGNGDLELGPMGNPRVESGSAKNAMVIKKTFPKDQIYASSHHSPGLVKRAFTADEYIVGADKFHPTDHNKSHISVPIKDIQSTHWGDAHPKHKNIESYVASLSDEEKNKAMHLHTNRKKSYGVGEGLTMMEAYKRCYSESLLSKIGSTLAKHPKAASAAGGVVAGGAVGHSVGKVSGRREQGRKDAGALAGAINSGHLQPGPASPYHGKKVVFVKS